MRLRLASNSPNPTDACQSVFPGAGPEASPGVRPSSGATTSLSCGVSARLNGLGAAELAAPEDGRTPVVRQGHAGRAPSSAPSYKPNQSNGNPPLSLTVNAGSKAGAAS